MDIYLKNIGNNTIRKNDYLLAESYQIGDFNPKEMMDITGGVVAIIAPTGAGKTVLLKDILSHTYKNYKKIHLFSRTAKLQKAYDFIPRSMITDDYNEEELSDLWDSQVKKNQQGKKMDNILVILDDIIASPSYKKSKMLDEFATAARQVNITVFILSQNFTSIKPIVRNNIRVAFTFQMQSAKERAKFSEQFLGADSARAGDILLRKITGTKYQCLIVQVYKNGDKLDDRVKKYIAEPDVVIEIEEPEEQRIIKQQTLVRPSKISKKVLIRPQKKVDKYGI